MSVPLNYAKYGTLNPYTFGNEYRHDDLVASALVYERLRDVLESRIKEKGITYLPHPAPSLARTDIAEYNERYAMYHKRAVWQPATKRTKQGLVGQVFLRNPAVKLPTGIEYIRNAASLDGLPLDATAAIALGEAVSMGRCALKVDTVRGGGITARSFIDVINAEDIITWATVPQGTTDAENRALCMVMVRQVNDELDTKDYTTVRKVATLTHYILVRGNIVQYRTLRSDQPSKTWSAWDTLRGSNGQAFDSIPIFFIGAENNSTTIDTPPLMELADLNISHYCNTADYEEMVFVSGQATFVFSGLTKDWVKDVFKNAPIAVGTRAPISLPVQARASLLQVQANGVAKEAVAEKSKMMVAIGARLIEERQIRRTATEASIEDEAYHSILGAIATNVSYAFVQALTALAYFDGVDLAEPVSYKLNTDFGYLNTSVEFLRLMVECWHDALLTDEEIRVILRQATDHIKEDASTALLTAKAELKARLTVAAEVKAAYTTPNTNTLPAKEEPNGT